MSFFKSIPTGRFSLTINNEFSNVNDIPEIDSLTLAKENEIYDTLKSLGKDFNNKRERISDSWNIQKFLKELYPEAIIIESEDCPDLIAKINNKYVGIEHTRIYEDSIRKYALSTYNILDKASKKYKQLYPNESSFTASIGFMNNYIFLDKYGITENQMIDMIVEWVHSVREKMNYNYHAIADIQNKINYLYLETILNKNNWDKIFSSACFITEADRTEFHLFSFLYEFDLTQDKLNEIIIKKSNNIDRYKQYKMKSNPAVQIDEFWLLLVVNSSRSECNFHYDENHFQSINTTFDKLYILNDYERKVSELQKNHSI